MIPVRSRREVTIIYQGHIRRFSKIGLPQTINFKRIFHEINLPGIGVPPWLRKHPYDMGIYGIGLLEMEYIHIYIYIFWRSIGLSSYSLLKYPNVPYVFGGKAAARPHWAGPHSGGASAGLLQVVVWTWMSHTDGSRIYRCCAQNNNGKPRQIHEISRVSTTWSSNL